MTPRDPFATETTLRSFKFSRFVYEAESLAINSSLVVTASLARFGAIRSQLYLQFHVSEHFASHLHLEQPRAGGSLHGNQHDEVRRSRLLELPSDVRVHQAISADEVQGFEAEVGLGRNDFFERRRRKFLLPFLAFAAH